ncbi:MAG: hypothetical protein NT004_17545 [Bacteroidetes bacterium]|nr:hypothetical protein [Bacteroidota bacterium]
MTFHQFRFCYWIIILLFPFISHSQISILPVAPACQGQTIQLSAIVTGVYGTESYSFEQFPYSPESYNGGTAVIMTDDDVFPDDNIGLEIGFPFCFLNSSVEHFWIGSNGWISFLPVQPTAWQPSTLPNPDAPKCAIFAPWQDWNPEVGPQAAEGYIFYRSEGVAPDRKLIVIWKDCPLYNCEDSTGQFQIVIHETSNVIDNHITRKPYCDWNSNIATQGIQNALGTAPVYIAFGRNQNSWQVYPGQEESTHFVPSGITWHQGTPTGPVVGAGDKIFVTATVTTTYWAVLAACDNTGNYQDSVNVIINPLPVPTFTSGDSVVCENDTKTYTTESGGNYYQWEFTGGTFVAGGDTNQNWITIQWTGTLGNSVSINYRSFEGCEALNPAVLNVTVSPFDFPVINSSANEYCAETEVTFSTQSGKTNYTWEYLSSGAVLISGGTTTDNTIVLKWSGSGLKTISVNYTDPGGCIGDPPSTKSVTIKAVPVLAGPFSKTICSGENTAINLVSNPAGADFAWNLPPPGCSPNIVLCPTGSSTGTSINDVISINDYNQGLVDYHITPLLNGCSPVNPETFSVAVNPIPSVTFDPASSTAICSGTPAAINFLSPVPGTIFNWSVPSLPPGITMINTSGTGNVLETILNSSTAPVTVVFNVTPLANNCSPANPSTYPVIVNPIPSVTFDPTSTTVLCSGLPAVIHFLPSVAGTIFNWSVPSLPTGISMTNTSGTGNVNEIIVNTTNAPVTVVFDVTPVANNCSPANPATYSLAVNPIPSVTFDPASTTAVCSGTEASILFLSPVAGTVFNWSVPFLPPGISMTNTSGTGNVLETILNSTVAPVTVGLLF